MSEAGCHGHRVSGPWLGEHCSHRACSASKPKLRPSQRNRFFLCFGNSLQSPGESGPGQGEEWPQSLVACPHRDGSGGGQRGSWSPSLLVPGDLGDPYLPASCLTTLSLICEVGWSQDHLRAWTCVGMVWHPGSPLSLVSLPDCHRDSSWDSPDQAGN